MQTIRQIEQDLCTAIKAKDTKAVLALYLPDSFSSKRLHVYDVLGPRQYEGAESFAKVWHAFFESNRFDVCRAEDLVVDVSGDLASAYLVQHAELTDQSGNKVVANTRMTHIFRRIDGNWLITHEHASFPVDWQTGMADMLSET